MPDRRSRLDGITDRDKDKSTDIDEDVQTGEESRGEGQADTPTETDETTAEPQSESGGSDKPGPDPDEDSVRRQSRRTIYIEDVLDDRIKERYKELNKKYFNQTDGETLPKHKAFFSAVLRCGLENVSLEDCQSEIKQ